PVADLLDVQFTDDGNAVDVSPMQMEVKTMGAPEVALNEKFGRNSARMTNGYGAGTSNYYRIEYSGNQAFKDALADGHTLELLFSANYEEILDKETKPFSGHEGGGTGLMINGNNHGYELNFLPHVGGEYRWTQSGIVPSPHTYYHMVGVWNKEEGKAYIYINGKLAGEANAAGDLKFPGEAAQWFGIGGDASGNMEAQSGSNWEIVAARIYDKPLEGGEVEALWYNFCGTDMTEPDKHQWDENGVCSTCGELNSDFVSTDADGYFLVGNVQQWNWVRTYVSTRKASVKVRLTADLDLSGLQNPSLATFRGTLDGQGHSVKLDIVSPEVARMGLVRFATGGCTLKNLAITEDSHVEGAAFTGGFIGASVPSSGTITMDRLVNYGEVVAHGANAGGIVGCCAGSSTTFILTNCCATGVVVGDKESGAISGWVGSSATLTNCWAVADVSGNDEGKYLYRGSAKVTNCYNTVDEQVTMLGGDAVESGELAWKLNGQSFANPVWYQNIEAGDPYPTFDATRGIVYAKASEEYATLDPSNEASVATFIKDIVTLEQEYVEELVARQALIDEFNA
ncbi:MAG: LamG-like jellyroll fold domain-containing protein, partial [Bacteroidaceae bacterium]